MGLLQYLKTTAFGKAGDNLELAARATPYGSQAIAQIEPPGLELSRLGKRFYGGLGIIANGIAPDTAIPTTTAKLALYNSSLTKSLILEWLTWSCVSGTPTAGSSLFVAISNGEIATAPTMATGYGVACAAGPGFASAAILGTAVTLPASSVWAALAANFQLAAANVGQGDRPVSLNGAIIIPPKHALGIAVLSGTGTTPLYSVSGQWVELDLRS